MWIRDVALVFLQNTVKQKGRMSFPGPLHIQTYVERNAFNNKKNKLLHKVES